MTVTIACSEPGVYQVLLQNRGKSYFHRIKSLCASPFTTENIGVNRVLALFARNLSLKVRAFEIGNTLLLKPIKTRKNSIKPAPNTGNFCGRVTTGIYFLIGLKRTRDFFSLSHNVVMQT